MFGVSRQAFYGREERSQQFFSHSMLILDMVSALRREIPGLGTRKLHLLLNEPLAISGIKLGRDKLHKLLQNHDLVLRQRRKVPQTTNSNHRLKMYPNLLIDKVILQPRQVWVCDITYICIGLGFGYLSLVTDAYSKLIVGYCLYPFLTAEGSLKALEMALLTNWEKGNGLIHHSDRGSQYCSFEYVRRLKRAGISISMTQSGDPYENAIAERINGILKTDFRLNRVFTTFEEAAKAVSKSIYNYNNLRPHMSCDYLTPSVAHESKLPLKKHWKPKVYKHSKDTRDQGSTT
ncbi:IS3 family transposase [Runella sp. S5]|uniref:IS3 family transposase n=1 Tax=Runella salmonicolor TaxID=2950278 RepID=A0ABT1FVS4_9BACT|nr:IS3 family transposase [Runella salmonicolor]